MSVFQDFTHFRREIDNMFRDFDRQFYGPGWLDEDFNLLNNQKFQQDRLMGGNEMDKERMNTEQVGGVEKNTSLQRSGGEKVGVNKKDQRVGSGVGSGLLSSRLALQPFHCSCDVVEQKDKYIVHAELPGIDKNDIKLNIDGNLLTVSAERKHVVNEEDKDKHYIRRERSYGSISRSLQIPPDVDCSKIQAKHENGLLNITLPRLEKKVEAPKHTITIQ